MVNIQSKPTATVLTIYNSITMHNAGPCNVRKSNVLFGVKSEYKGNAKWLFIRNYLLAMIRHGIIPYDIETAMADLIHIDTAFKLQCNTSMIELEDGLRRTYAWFVDALGKGEVRGY